MGLVGFFVESLRGRTFGVREFIPAFPAFAMKSEGQHSTDEAQTQRQGQR